LNKELITLCVDAARGNVKRFAHGQEHKADEAIRMQFYNALGLNLDGDVSNRAGLRKDLHRALRRNESAFFEVIEDVLNTTIPDAWDGDPFYREFVDRRNLSLGDKNEFVVGNYENLIVATFSGNHWNTDRHTLTGKRSFPIDTEWSYIRLYADLELFLTGKYTFVEFVNALRGSFQRDIDNRTAQAFNGADVYLPAAFTKSGTPVDVTLWELIDRVQVAAQSPVRITGTRAALMKLYKGVGAEWISEKMKEDMNSTGSISNLNGVPTLIIPQSFITGTTDFAISSDSVFILPQNDKPIKLVYEGDSRVKRLDSQDTGDMTLDLQVQMKVGVGVAFHSIFGKYTFA